MASARLQPRDLVRHVAVPLRRLAGLGCVRGVLGDEMGHSSEDLVCDVSPTRNGDVGIRARRAGGWLHLPVGERVAAAPSGEGAGADSPSGHSPLPEG